MSEPSYTTRAQASAPPAHLVRLMATAAYEAGRPKESGRPEFENTTTEWQDAMCREMSAALVAAEVAGYRIVKP